MKVLVCGDRNWIDWEEIRDQLKALKTLGYTDLIEGEARGADTLAREEGEELGFVVHPFPANWDKYHKAAGSIRNREMLDQCPDLVLAFHHDLSKSKGTKDCVMEARKRGIKVKLVT